MDKESFWNTPQELIDWFWNFGVQREGAYTLPFSGWLNNLYSLSKQSSSALKALEQQRPALAIWGPSQTGKSTLLSAYMDGSTPLSGDENEDGRETGLHWEGGLPFYFMAPLVKDPSELPWYMTRKVLNPFNKGMDGSSCLSRFLPGSLDGREGTRKIEYPKFPVELKQVTPKELWHALARGYSSECLGPNNGDTTKWNLELLKKAINRFIRKNPAEGKSCKEAYESLHDFQEVITELAESDDSTFKGLGKDLNALQSSLRDLLEEPALLCSRTRVEEFAAEVLWEGYEKLTDFYNKMATVFRQYSGNEGVWSGKQILCSLEATALFLNMGACNISYSPPSTNPKSPENQIQTLISDLGWREDGCNILIGCEPGMTHKLGTTPEQFSIFQGLVWELVIPVNLDNLHDSPIEEAPERPNALKSLLMDVDLLDFPGVGNETKSYEKRIVLDQEQIHQITQKASRPDASGADKERQKVCFNPQLFFKEILKRGKTASIVATYSKRLNIDGFSIFQGLSGYACPNADQLVNGIKNWWKNAVPEYFNNPKGSSPLPLNLVLTWWAKQLNLATNPNDSNIYGVIEEVVSHLGTIRDPETATIFAINNHKSPDKDRAEIKMDFNPGAIRYNNITSEIAFRRQFSNPVSRESFDSMLTDMETGGAEYFILKSRDQILETRKNDDTNRVVLLKNKLKVLENDFKDLLHEHEIFPNPKPKDTRREHLKAFNSRLQTQIDNANIETMRSINATLRELLNIDYEKLSAIPYSKAKLTSDFIITEYQQWITQQCARCEEDGSPSSPLQPDWRYLGIGSTSEMRQFLTALLHSIYPNLESVITWLRKQIDYNNAAEFRDLRRILALKMSNLITYGEKGARSRMGSWEDDDFDLNEETPSAINNAKMSPHYTYFLAPFAGQRGRLENLIDLDLNPIKRPDQPGDPELVQLCAKHELNPLKKNG